MRGFMENINFDDYAGLGNYMYKLAKKKSQAVASVLLYEDALELLKWLMLYDDLIVNRLNIESEIYQGYDKEFYVMLDSDLILDVMPAYQAYEDYPNKVGYLPLDSDIILYGEDVSSKLALQNVYGNKYEIVIKNNDGENCINKCSDCCEDCSCCPRRETCDVVSESLNMIEYLFNHYYDD